MLNSVATSVQLTAQRNLINHERDLGQRQVGSLKVVVLKVGPINMNDSDPATGRVPTVSVDACWDVSGTDLVDKGGHSVVSPTRPDRGWTRYTVMNYHWSSHPHDGWRISTGRDLKRAPCAVD